MITMPQLEQETEETRAIDAQKRRRSCGCFCGCVGMFAVFILLLVFFGDKIFIGHDFGCAHDEKDILLAMHIFATSHNHFPPAYTTDKDGKPLHSWRVLLLPYLEQRELYDKIRLDEPWDSEYNSQFHTEMPLVYQCHWGPKKYRKPGMTSYMRIVGQGTTTDGPNAVDLRDIKGDTSKIVALVEVYPTINWMEPTDISPKQFAAGVDPKRKQGIGSFHHKGLYIGMIDGSVKWISVDEIVQYKDKTTISTDSNQQGKTQ